MSKRGKAARRAATLRALPLSRTPTEIAAIEAIASNPDMIALAAAVPLPKPGPGRKSAYPLSVFLVYQELACHAGSHRAGARMMAEPAYWRVIRRTFRDCHNVDLPKQAPTRDQCDYGRATLAAHHAALYREFRNVSVAQALEHGCFDPNAPRTVEKLNRATFVAMDGTVVKAPIREKTARRWADEGHPYHAKSIVEAGDDHGRRVFGTKYIFATTRPDTQVNNRIIVDLRYDEGKKGYGGEAGISIAALLELARRAPGLQGVCYDGAFRGVHADQAMKAGLVVLSPVHDGLKPLAVKRFPCRCGVKHHVWAKDGALHEQILLDTGKPTLVPLSRHRLYARRTGTGPTRWYQEFAALCGTLHRDRIDSTADDDPKVFNRAENIRQHPPGTDTYTDCYGWREDAESVNSVLDETLYRSRMPAYKLERQHLFMLGHALARNSIARALLRRSAMPPGELAA